MPGLFNKSLRVRQKADSFLLVGRKVTTQKAKAPKAAGALKNTFVVSDAVCLSSFLSVLVS